ncbi:cation transporter [Microbacterium sp. MEJ108Y]|nr:cation transporter [Microbacterium sp. MEJ108Y]
MRGSEIAASARRSPARQGILRWIPVIVVGYLAAFTLLGTILAMGMPVGVAYGVWSAAGVAITAILGRVIFKDHFSVLMAIGVALIALGVLLIEFGGSH